MVLQLSRSCRLSAFRSLTSEVAAFAYWIHFDFCVWTLQKERLRLGKQFCKVFLHWHGNTCVHSMQLMLTLNGNVSEWLTMYLCFGPAQVNFEPKNVFNQGKKTTQRTKQAHYIQEISLWDRMLVLSFYDNSSTGKLNIFHNSPVSHGIAFHSTPQRDVPGNKTCLCVFTKKSLWPLCGFAHF